LSYDVVALVAGEPDLPAIVDALQGADPELSLHQHKDTGVLQIRDRNGRLLATLEPGQRVEARGEVARLLGTDVVAGVPDPFWWVETRARPDEEGREVAHRFADSLVLGLGGAVWTSGAAEFGLWQESEHPAVERAATRALLVAQDRTVVPFSSWLSDAVATHGDRQVLQVLTPPTARLTYGARTFLSGPLGRWVVRGEDGEHYDGLTGLAVHWDDEHGFLADKEPSGPNWAAREPDAAPVPGFLVGFAEDAGTQLLVDVYAIHRNPVGPHLGRAAEIVTEHLTGHVPSAWGPHEPALREWDRERLARFAAERGPRASILYLSGPSGAEQWFSGLISLTHQGERVLERASIVVGFEDRETVPFGALPDLVEALAEEGLLEGLRVRRLPGRGDTTYEPVWAGLPAPVGVAIGPERLRAIGLGRAQAGPITGTLLGEGADRALWYPVLGSAEEPLRSLWLMQRQIDYLSSVPRG